MQFKAKIIDMKAVKGGMNPDGSVWKSQTVVLEIPEDMGTENIFVHKVVAVMPAETIEKFEAGGCKQGDVVEVRLMFMTKYTQDGNPYNRVHVFLN